MMARKIRLRACAVIVDNGKLLSVKHAHNNKEYYVLPGGGVELNESIIQALVRELKEECNVKIKPLRLICIGEFNDVRMNQRIIDFFFLSEIMNGKIGIGDNKGLVVDIQWISIDCLNSIDFRPKKFKEWLSENYESDFNTKKLYLGEYT